MDTLQKNGTMKQWAKDISGALTSMFNQMGFGKTTVQDIGDKIVQFTRAVADATPAIKGAVDVLTSMGSAMGTIFTIFGQLPD
jgi:hypothetical protein